MNDSFENIDDLLLDRLVDGELSAEEYRQVLSQLDQMPNGWRRCAHAFLESQALEQALPLVMQTAPSCPQTEPAPTVEKSSNSGTASFRRMETLAAMAASVMVAFGLGMYISGADTPAVDMPGGGLTTNVGNPQLPPDAPMHTVAKPQFVYVNQWDGQQGGGMPIAIDPNKQYDPQAEWDTSWGMNPEQLQKLKDSGQSYQTKNRLIPVSLDNGDRVVVPVQDVIVYEKPDLPYH
ncbi:hypothetical protein C5Y96_02050 [Blastopirellula marina]|uniref:Anti sigma-E protein RseA N-terminal domain-containing protein n=1 Tax=Blastopirellula marina TaxID=124 RepID=A0A2S8G2L6_9BACT|nr:MULTISPECIES: hypothetical protein [Pirellulaceae]PQO38688.1 hypothetical protein C5Y96_02050 [Blastopirellula marina]RCS54996.1 hypothetical protein DTL36_02055 [Bremerella cremea]